MNLRPLTLLAPGLVAIGLAGCGPSLSERSELAASCPQVMRVQDTTSLTRFRPGAGRDRTDTLFEARIGKTEIACDPRKDRVIIELTVEIAVTEGPATRDHLANVSYFVRIIDPAGTVVQGQNFAADYKFEGNRTSQASSEQLTLTIPLGQGLKGGAYTVAVGLLPTPEELDYNRRGGGGR